MHRLVSCLFATLVALFCCSARAGDLPIFQIWEIQGSSLTSPVQAAELRTEGNVVTAIGAGGFFMQSSAEAADGDAATSDGIFVDFVSQTPPAVGDVVDVEGIVEESNGLTQLVASSVTVTGTGTPPTPINLNANDPTPVPSDPYLALERREGMMVRVDGGTVTAPSDLSGDAKIVAGPFRQYRGTGVEFPGLPDLPLWDGNPEIFEVDPDALGFAEAQLFANTNILAIGPLSSDEGGLEVWPSLGFDVTPDPEFPAAIRERAFREMIAVSMNLQGFVDDVDDGNGAVVVSTLEYETQVQKLLLNLRDVLRYPEVVAVQDAEEAALAGLADAIQVDGGPEYAISTLPGNNSAGEDLAFLTRSDVIQVDSVTQFGAALVDSNLGVPLYAQPPLILEATHISGDSDLSFTIINVQLLDMDGLELPSEGEGEGEGEPVTPEVIRQIRAEQADLLSQFVQSLQTGDPNLRLIVLGDFNSLQFTDGIVDVLGQITGSPDLSGSLIPATSVVIPALNNLTLTVDPLQRYNAIIDGNAAALDHILTNDSIEGLVQGFNFVRGNSDVPASFSLDSASRLRASDRDFLAVFLGTALAIQVDTLADENDGDLSEGDISLREATTFVADGGTITFDASLFNEPQTLTLDPQLGFLTLSRAVSLFGPGKNLLTIDAAQQTRVLLVEDSAFFEQIEVEVRDVTLANGNTAPEEGGGISNAESLTLVNVDVLNCTSPIGGGIANLGILRMDNCTVSGCNAAFTGGGINNAFFSRLEMLECNIIDNSTLSGSGGGIYMDIFISASSAIRRSTIARNESGADGGGIWTSVPMIIVNSTISGNSAAGDGGGAFEQSDGLSQFVSCTITGNIADSDADGAGTGGGIFSRFLGASLFNNLIVGNFDTPGNAGPDSTLADVAGDFSVTGNNAIGISSAPNSPDTGFGPSDLLLDELGYTQPSDLVNLELADNGGPTLTHALASGSPAINAGSALFADDPELLAPLLIDQRGTGFPRIVAGGLDIGAVEAQPDTVAPTVTIEQAAGQVDPTNQLPVEFEVVFSEAVTGFDSFDLLFSGTAAGVTFEVEGAGSIYTVRATAATKDGSIVLAVRDEAAQDPFGNLSEASLSNDNAVVLERTLPVLLLNGAAEILLECGNGYTDPGATATDTVQGDLTGSIVITGEVDPQVVGVYVITYDVTDSVGNAAATATRTVTVEDTEAPVMTLAGQNPIRIPCGTAFFDPRAGAQDACNGNISGIVESDTSDLNPNQPGTYTVIYSVTDLSGNTATLERSVIVERSLACGAFHSSDIDGDNKLSLQELLRIVQFFNIGGYHCDGTTFDGYAAGPGNEECVPHATDFSPQNWQISLPELLRAIQFFNLGGYRLCPGEETPDGFCAGLE